MRRWSELRRKVTSEPEPDYSMGKINISQAKRPTRTQQEGMMTSSGSEFRRRMPASARRHTFLRREVLWPAREAVVNSNRTEIQDIDGKTEAVSYTHLTLPTILLV